MRAKKSKKGHKNHEIENNEIQYEENYNDVILNEDILEGRNDDLEVQKSSNNKKVKKSGFKFQVGKKNKSKKASNNEKSEKSKKNSKASKESNQDKNTSQQKKHAKSKKTRPKNIKKDIDENQSQIKTPKKQSKKKFNKKEVRDIEKDENLDIKNLEDIENYIKYNEDEVEQININRSYNFECKNQNNEEEEKSNNIIWSNENLKKMY